jgi:hypothetical protein
MTSPPHSSDACWTTSGKLVSFRLCFSTKILLISFRVLCVVLMYIHRSFFAQAIIEYPVNPLKSPYAPSFLAAYRASSTILKSIREQFNMWPNSCSRFWTMWTFAFSAAVSIQCIISWLLMLPCRGIDILLILNLFCLDSSLMPYF